MAFIHQLIDSAQKSTEIAFIVEQISSAYCEISQKNFLPMVADFSKLLALKDVKDESAKIVKPKIEMNKLAGRTLAAIEKKMISEKVNLTKMIKAREGRFFWFSGFLVFRVFSCFFCFFRIFFWFFSGFFLFWGGFFLVFLFFSVFSGFSDLYFIYKIFICITLSY
jgi:hypothetical protein